MGENAAPDSEDFQNFLIASAVTGAAFTAFSGSFTLENLVFYLVAGIVVIALRETGQRTVAHWMDSYVDLKVSTKGSTTTLLAAGFSVVSDFSLILLFPITSEFSGKSYEQWGKEVDAMWIKRKYWISSSGIIALWTGWIAAYMFSMNDIAGAISIFTIFQLMPFDYETIPTDPLDGATILRWSGFIWLIMTGLSIIMLALTI